MLTTRIAAIAAGCLLAAAQGLAQGEWSPRVSPAPPTKERTPGPDFAAAQALVRSRLRDPESARFGKVWAGRQGAVCGYVNARNAFGGYTGQQPWVLPPAGRVLLGHYTEVEGRPAITGPDEDAFVAAWNRHCAGTG